MYRICTKNPDGSIDRVLLPHSFHSYDAACDFVHEKIATVRDGKSEDGHDTRILPYPLTVCTQREVKPCIIAGKTTEDTRRMRAISGWSTVQV